MAKPPEPIDEVLPLAVFVVDAEVTQVVSEGPQPPKVGKPGETSTGQLSKSQVVKLKVNKALHGKPPAVLTVNKPEAGYSLREGNHGPFLIDAKNNILGRYGPDSYSMERVEKALASKK